MAEKSLERLHEQADEIIGTAVDTAQQTEQINDFFFLLGGLDAVNTIVNNLNSAMIVNCQRIRDSKDYKLLGYQRFDEFMDEHPRSPMPYKRFNYIEGIFNNLGPQVFDLLSGSGLSMRQQKLLNAGDIVVEGDEVVIGGEERVPLGEQKVIKSIIEKLVNEKRDAADALAKVESKNEDLKVKLDRGQSDYDQLERNLEALRKRDPLTAQFNTVVYEMCEFHRVVGQQPDELKASVGTAWLQVLASLYFRTADAFGIKAALADRDAVLTGDTLDAKIAEVIAEAGPMNFEDSDDD